MALHPTVPNIETRFNSLHENKQTCPSHEYANLPLPLINGKIICRVNNGMCVHQRQLEEVGLLVFPGDCQTWRSSSVFQTLE